MRVPTFLMLCALLDLTCGSRDLPLKETSDTVALCIPNCNIHETCIIKDGVAVCQPNFYGTCLITGKSKVKTFDGSIQDFPGNCPCVLSKSDGDNNGLEPFTVVLSSTPNSRSRMAQAEDRVDMHVYGYKVSASSNLHGKLEVNDVVNNLPLQLDNGKISAYMSGSNTVMKTDFGAYVSYQENWYTDITLPSSYYNRTGGLCGNFNLNAADDLPTM